MKNSIFKYQSVAGFPLSDITGNILPSLASIKSFFNSLIGKQNPQIQAPQTTTSVVTTNNVQKTTTWDSVTDKRIATLDSRVQQPAINFINNTESKLGIQLRISEGYRTGKTQNSYFAQGRTQEQLDVVGLNDVTARPDLKKNTNAIAGLSYHNYGRALDAYFMENGKMNVNKQMTSDVANIAIKEGFKWGASFKDYPHFEMSLGQSIRELYKTYTYDQ